MAEPQIMTLEEIGDIAFHAFVKAGASEENARLMAIATAQTEADGIASHDFAYIPTYFEHVQCRNVDGKSQPEASFPAPGLIWVDAATGFAHPAIDLGFRSLVEKARTLGVAALAVYNSYNCGILGYHTRRLAKQGLLAIGFTNAPASIAPVGGSTPVVGTTRFH